MGEGRRARQAAWGGSARAAEAPRGADLAGSWPCPAFTQPPLPPASCRALLHAACLPGQLLGMVGDRRCRAAHTDCSGTLTEQSARMGRRRGEGGLPGGRHSSEPGRRPTGSARRRRRGPGGGGALARSPCSPCLGVLALPCLAHAGPRCGIRGVGGRGGLEGLHGGGRVDARMEPGTPCNLLGLLAACRGCLLQGSLPGGAADGGAPLGEGG
jgi:hypothetical protein